jgi:isochorismate hydrolase
MSKALVALQMPSPPDPVPVLIDAATTALLIFDVIEHICAREPKCREQLVPAVASLLERARQAGVAIAYGTRAANMSTWLPEVAPMPNDIKIESHAQDRFYNTDLDEALKAKEITTLVLIGWKISGSVTYTSVGAHCCAFWARKRLLIVRLLRRQSRWSVPPGASFRSSSIRSVRTMCRLPARYRLDPRRR